ncbi:RNaseH domain-containing protein [Mesobacillus sp. AQ2]|uniref:RNaseH domain-containing protein n=1 Tax=Mesobacillus sp. AQ2 TaxID=3043332 RepID=UPI0024C0FE35|nr:RNaseH domain-containing protein [Mesobacillus sp. AQ2]WHX40373.1 RNaseH domain-containing protein [Mesobacillus sp. AQ2]
MNKVMEDFSSVFEDRLQNEGIKDYLQPLRYKIDKNHLEQAVVVAFYMPDKWKEMTRAIYFRNHRKNPIRDLIKDIEMEYPEIYTCYLAEPSYYGDEPFLFINKEEYDSKPAMLKDISLSFVKLLKEYNRLHKWYLDLSVVNSFVIDPVVKVMHLSEVIHKPYKMAILNGYFTSQLCKVPLNVTLEVYKYIGEEKLKTFDVIEEVLYFSHASGGGLEHSAVSRPIEIDGGYCSFVLSFSLYEPISNDDHLYLQLKTSVRQWISYSEPTDYKSFKNNVSLYMGNFKKDGGSSIISTTLRAKQGSDEGIDYVIPSVHKERMEDFGTSIRDVLDSTVTYIQNGMKEDGLFIGFPVANATISWWVNHWKFKMTGNGVTLEEERNFYERAAEVVEGIEPVDGHRIISSKGAKVLGKGKSKQVHFSKMLLPAMLKNQEVSLNVFVPDEKYIESFKEEFLALVEDQQDKEIIYPLRDGNAFRIKFLNGYMTIRYNAILMKSAFKIYEGAKEEKIAEVQSEVTQYLSDDIIEMNIFFIPDYHKHPEYKKKDPLKLIRKAFLQLGKHVQFINYPVKENIQAKTLAKSNINHPYRNAFLDALSKLGVEQAITKYNAPSKVGETLADKIIEIGVIQDYLDKKSFLFLTKYDGDNTYIKAAGVTDWYAYHEVAKLFKKLCDSKTRGSYVDETFIMDHVTQELFGIEKPVVLYISANLRQKLSWLSNKNFKVDKNPLISQLPNISIIRVNTWSDVPDYYTRKFKRHGSWENSQVSGIFQDSENIYYSLAGRGDQIYGQLGKTRIGSEQKEEYKKKRLVELVILNANPNISEVELANLAHQRRRVNISYDSYTNYPQALYWLEQMMGDYGKMEG